MEDIGTPGVNPFARIGYEKKTQLTLLSSQRIEIFTPRESLTAT